MKALFIINEVLDPNSSSGALGVGYIRALELSWGLEAAGIETVCALPDHEFLKLSDAQQSVLTANEELTWKPQRQKELIRIVAPDVIVFTPSWDHAEIDSEFDQAIVLDLCSTRFRSHHADGSSISSALDPERKLKLIARADLILAANNNDRLYLYGWLVQAGRVPDLEHFIKLVPLGISPKGPIEHADADFCGGIERFISNKRESQVQQRLAHSLLCKQFAWPDATAPLREFLTAPVRAKMVEPAIGAVYSRPSFLRSAASAHFVPLAASGASCIRNFVLPAENISAIEVSIKLLSDAAREQIEYVELRLRKSNGHLVCKRRVPPAELPEQQGALWLLLPMVFQLQGGRKYRFEISVCTKKNITGNSRSLLAINTVSELNFPLIPDNARRLSLEPAVSQSEAFSNSVGLALNFVPGEASKIYRVKLSGKRALELVRRGEWRRFYRAIVKRLPSPLRRLVPSGL